MAVDPGDGGHGEGGEAREQAEQRGAVEVRRGVGVVEVEAVAEELGDARGRDQDAGGVLGLQDVEGQQEGLAEGGREAVVGRRREGEEVGEGRGEGGGYGAACGGDGEDEEGAAGGGGGGGWWCHDGC